MKRFLLAAVLLLGTAATGSAQDIPLSKILVEGETWRTANKDVPGITVLRGNPEGSLEIIQGMKVGKLTSDGKFIKDLDPLPPHRYDCMSIVTRNTISWVNKKDRTLETFKFTEKGDDVTELGKVKLEGLNQPNCLTLWPDEAQVVIGDSGGKYLWTARIDKDGKLGTPDRYYSLRVKPAEKASGVKAMVMDAGNLLYAATPLGVQVFDPTGRLCGVILPPAKEEMTAITIGGEKGDTLYVACGDKIYARKIQGKATYTLKKEK